MKTVSAFIFGLLLVTDFVFGSSDTVEIKVDLGTERVIKLGDFEKSQLDRDKYFRSYHMPGLFSEEMSEELKEIGALPGRGTGPYYSYDKQHSYDSSDMKASADRQFEKWIEKQNEKYSGFYKKAAQRYPGLKHALAYNPNFPEKMRRGNEGKDKGILASEYYDDFAKLIVGFYDKLKAEKCSYPSWYTTQNEPPYQWGAEDFAKYSAVMAKVMSRAHPDIKICGPCSAWPYPQTDWKRWNGWEKKFVDIAGRYVGAYDLHFYSKGYWAYSDERLMGDPLSKRQPQPSLYVSQKNGCSTVWDYGRADGLLDLFAAYHSSRYNSQPKPMIISEFGRQGIEPQLGPWENDFKPWLYMTTVVRLWMTFMERPEVELTIPFILGQSDFVYGAARGQAVYTRPNAPEDKTTQVTRFHDFYSFFKDLDGSRISSQVNDRDVLVRSFADDNIVYILVHNGKGYPQGKIDVDISFALKDASGKRVDVLSSQIKRMRWQGPVPADHTSTSLKGKLIIDTENQYHSLDNFSGISLDGEETAIVKLTLKETPRTARITEYIDYSKDILISPDKEGKCSLTLRNTNPSSKLKKAVLYLALAVDDGFSKSPVVKFNGSAVEIGDLSFSEGIKDFHYPIPVEIPVEHIEGSNRIDVEFNAESCDMKNVKVVTAKLVTYY
ncbi:MAG: hypothetical protein ACIAQZ_05640 [Sedimentisphaeraceae bacterium JB056]